MSVMGGMESTKKIREWESQSQARRVPVVGLSGKSQTGFN